MNKQIDHQRGTWKDIREEKPRDHSMVFTLTKEGVIGVHYFVDDEFISMMPTYMGEPNRWLKNPEGGIDIYDETIPQPELSA